jgi:hypothetical protein
MSTFGSAGANAIGEGIEIDNEENTSNDAIALIGM